MPRRFDCPYLGEAVELTDEREAHIAAEHRDFAPFMDRIDGVLQEPDTIRRSRRDPQSLLFARWYDDINDDKYLIVVVVTHQVPVRRHWIVTAYMTSRLSGGTVQWERG